MSLNIAIIGAGLGGLCAAIALRRQGHYVTMYERHDFAGEVGGGIGVVSNSTYFLEKVWNVDMPKAKPVVLKKMVRHDWKSGEVLGEQEIGDYKGKFGSAYYGVYRLDLHHMLLDEALQEKGKGPPCKLVTNHSLLDVDPERGICKFENRESVQADLVVGADGIKVCYLPARRTSLHSHRPQSRTREAIGLHPKATPSSSCCYRCIISASKLSELGLDHFNKDAALLFWGGQGIDRIVIGPAHDNEMRCVYAFYPAERNDLREDGWNIEASPQQLADTFPDLDPTVKKLFFGAEDIKMWRLFVHPQYPYWTKGRVCLLGDAAHPMMPDQNQGFSQAAEDAGALGLIFSEEHAGVVGQDILLGLQLYEKVRKERASVVQAASFRARTDMRERFGWADPKTDQLGKLTLEWLCEYDMVKHVKEVLKEVEERT